MGVLVNKSCLAVAAVALLGSIATVHANDLDRQMTFTNRSHHTITQFYASNVAAGTWEKNILGGSALLPGHSIRVDLNDRSGYCSFDFKTITDDGIVIVHAAVNVCTTATYTVVDG